MNDQTLSEIAALRSQADSADREVAELERRYGTGTRPAWVGDEIGILHHRAKSARAKADEMEAAHNK